MYKQFNLSAVPQSEFLANHKAISTLEKYWDKKLENGVLVYDRFQLYDGHSVRSDRASKEIFKMVGTSYDKLSNENWKGVDRAFFYFKPVDFDSSAITGLDLYRALGSSSEEAIYTEHTVTFKVVTGSKLDVSGIKYLLDRRDPKVFDGFIEERGDYVDQRWNIAYADIDNKIFEYVTFNVPDSVYTPNRPSGITNSKYVDASGIGGWTQVIQITYKMRDNVFDEPDVYYDDVFQVVKSNDLWPSKWYTKNNISETAVDDLPVGKNGVELFSTKRVPVMDANGTVIYEVIEVSLRADAFSNVHISKVSAFFKSMFAFDYDEEEVEWWVKLVVVVVIIIIVIVATLLAPATGGLSWYMAISAIAGVVALAATAISLVLTLYSGYLASMGMYKQAAAIGRVIVVLNDIAKYAGYVALIAGVYNIATNGMKQEVGKEIGKRMVKEGAKNITVVGGKYLVDVGWETLAAKVASTIKVIGEEILDAKYKDDEAEIAEAQDTLDEQERIMNEYASPDNIGKLIAYRDSYAYAEGLEAIDVLPYMMTQETLEKPFNLYYG